MIVAAGTHDRQAQQPASDRVDLVVDVLVPVVVFAAHGQKAQGGQVFRPMVRHQVGGQLQGDEAVIGLVPVQSVDDPVPVGVGVRIAAFAAEGVAAGVGVSGHVQPVPRPALAVPGGGQQSIHKPPVGVGPRVVDERFHFLRRGRHTPKVQRGPANQRAAVRFRRRAQPVLLQPGQHVMVPRLAGPTGAFHPGARRFPQRLQRPVFFQGLFETLFPGKGGSRFGLFPLGPVRSLANPLPQQFHFGPGQWLFRGHGYFVRVFARDGKKQAAFFRSPGHHGRAATVTAAEHGRRLVQPQAAFLGFRPVAFPALVGQQRADLGFKKDFLRLGGRSPLGPRTRAARGSGKTQTAENRQHSAGEVHGGQFLARRETWEGRVGGTLPTLLILSARPQCRKQNCSFPPGAAAPVLPHQRAWGLGGVGGWEESFRSRRSCVLGLASWAGASAPGRNKRQCLHSASREL